jgi:hypothetical protein
MHIRFEGSVPKHASEPQRNEDCWDRSVPRGLVAMSDGAGDSYGSARWAKRLVGNFLSNPVLDERWLVEAIREYSREFDFDALPWNHQAAFERGSFATLLGVRIPASPSQIVLTAVGDSVALLLDGDRVRRSFPYAKPQEFDQRPFLVSTRPAHNGELLSEHGFRSRTTTWSLEGLQRPTLVCATDALGRWLLEPRNGDRRQFRDLIQTSTQEAFVDFVERERANGRLVRDDTTMIVIAM